jgi:hypothetical protein
MAGVAEGFRRRRPSQASTLPVLSAIRRSQGLPLISPPFLFALVMLGLPILVVVIAHSFWTQNYLTIDRTFTLENYRIDLTEPIYRDLLMRSLWISLGGQRRRRSRSPIRSPTSSPSTAAGTRACGCSSSPSRSGRATCCASCRGR